VAHASSRRPECISSEGGARKPSLRTVYISRITRRALLMCGRREKHDRMN
jgi:hypothetical protein